VTLFIFRVESSSFKRICHPTAAQWRACPERSRRGPAVSFCPSDLTAPNNSHRPLLCHPESAAERSAVRPGSHTKVWVLLVLNRLFRSPGENSSTAAPIAASLFIAVLFIAVLYDSAVRSTPHSASAACMIDLHPALPPSPTGKSVKQSRVILTYFESMHEHTEAQFAS